MSKIISHTNMDISCSLAAFFFSFILLFNSNCDECIYFDPYTFCRCTCSLPTCWTFCFLSFGTQQQKRMNEMTNHRLAWKMRQTRSKSARRREKIKNSVIFVASCMAKRCTCTTRSLKGDDRNFESILLWNFVIHGKYCKQATTTKNVINGCLYNCNATFFSITLAFDMYESEKNNVKLFFCCIYFSSFIVRACVLELLIYSVFASVIEYGRRQIK